MTGIFCPFISCLLHTKTGQHSLPPFYMISGTPPRFTQLSWWSPAIDPHFTPNCQGCMIAKPQWDFPKSAGGAPHTSLNEVNALLHPYWRNVWLQNPNEIFPNLQKEFCIHPPDKVNPLLYPFGGMLSLHHCTPYQQSTSSPQLPMASRIGPCENASPAPMRHHNPFPLPLRPLASHIWTARVCVNRSNEIPKSLPLISLTSPEPTKH